MKSTSEIVRQWNEIRAYLRLTPARLEELPIELDQLAAAAESARGDVQFDVDPSDFRAALLTSRPGDRR
jgi:hypothetical protein